LSASAPKSNEADLRLSPVVLEVSDLTKSYGERRAVQEVSFSIRAGEVFGLLGPNGAGKTTTIGMIATIVTPTGGEVRVLGEPTDSRPKAAKGHLGLVPQRICLYPSLTAEENLLFFGRMYGLGRGRLAGRVDALLELTGLTARRQDQVSTFSGGMKRRLNLACGLVHEPKLLLLDEPTVGVDPQSRERIFTAVEELAASGMAVLYTTHYMEEAERLCHRLAIMDEGRFVAEGTVQQLARLMSAGGMMVVSFEEYPSESLLTRLRQLGARQVGFERFQMPGKSVEDLVSDLLHMASVENNSVRELVVHRCNLGEVFLHLTGKELRD
jgi:ABC-2 type transport system ATP-binding protein